MTGKRLFAAGLLLVLVTATAAFADSGKKPILTSSDDWSSIQLGLTVQMQYEYLERDRAGTHPDYVSRFRWRRIRPTFKGAVLGGDLMFYFHLSTAPGALEMMDFYLDYRIFPDIRVRAGQFKTPLNRYRIQSFKNLTLVDWSIATKYFGGERQLGLVLHNGYEKPNDVEYEVGIFNGLNSRSAHALGIALLTGEAVGKPSDLTGPAPLDEFHPALGARLAYNYGNIDTSTDTDFWKIKCPRFSVGAGVFWDANPVPYRDFSLRVSPEFLFQASGFSLMGAGYAGFYEQDGDIDGTSLAMFGGVAQASYLIGQIVEIAARATVVMTDEGFRDDAKERARKILADADPADLDSLTDQYGGAGEAWQEREFTAGVNVYIVGRTVKLQNDASILQHFVHGEDRLQDFRFRTQLQLAF